MRALTEHLEAGDRLDGFLDEFPTVSRERAVRPEEPISTGRRSPRPALPEIETRLREDALSIFHRALSAVDPEVLTSTALGGALLSRLSPPREGRLIVVSVGKAAIAMARGAKVVLGDLVAEGVAVAPSGSGGPVPAGFRIHYGGHPLPNPEGLAGAREVRDVARGAGPLDRILLLLSGGGSALLTLPLPGISLEDVRRVTDLLTLAGATIGELNAVRKHIESLKGGRLASLAHPAPLTALALSDVVGDPLDVIASGPVSPDPSTFAEALAVLEARAVWERSPASVRAHLELGRDGSVDETPEEDADVFAGVSVKVVGNAARAAQSAAEEARRLGYRARVESTEVTGEARDVGADLAASALRVRGAEALPACIVYAGETTVTVQGSGRGGRNQEVALGAARQLAGEEGVLVFSGGTDGVDGPTDAAGAMATGSTLPRALALGLDPDDHLERNDAYRFFEPLGDLVTTGPTGTNVMDLMFVMVGGSPGVPPTQADSPGGT